MSPARLATLARRRWPTALYALLALGILSWVSWEAVAVRAVTYDGRSDYWEHSATLHALLENPWHPKNPHLVSPASSPRFGPQFVLAALLGRAFHLDALGAMSLVACLNTLLLVGSIGLFFGSYFRDERAPLYGIIVMFGSWWQAWHFSNVYQLSVFFSVASYPSTTALGLTLLGFALGVRMLRGKVRQPRVALGLLVIWAGAVFVIHPLTAVMSLSGLGLLAIAEPEVAPRRRLEVIVAVAAGAGLARFWPYFSPWEVLAGGHSSASNWVADSVRQAARLDVKTQRHPFYRTAGLLNSLGLALIGVAALPYFLLRRERWFVGLGALSMLAPFIVNAYIELPLGHRFILLAIFYLQVAVVWLLLMLTPGSAQALPILQRRGPKVAAVAVVACILLVFAGHNLDAAQKLLANRRYRAGTPSPLVRDMQEVARHSGPNAVILATASVSWPVPSFGPKVLVVLHENPLLPDTDERQAAVARFLNQHTADDARRQILARYQVSHILLWRDANGALGRFLAEHATVRGIGSGFRLYTLGPIAEKP